MTNQHSSDLINQREYWKNELTNAPGMIQIPTDFSRSQNQKFIGEEYHFSIELKLMNKLAAIEKTWDSDMRATLLTVFGVLLFRYSAQDDFVVGVPFRKLKSDDFGSKTDSLSDKLPIRFLFKDDSSFAETLEIIKNKLNAALENHEAFDEQLIKKVMGVETLNPSDLFNVLFEFQTELQELSDHSDYNFKMSDEDRKKTGFDLALQIKKGDESLECIVKYNKELFAQETIESFVVFKRCIQFVFDNF